MNDCADTTGYSMDSVSSQQASTPDQDRLSDPLLLCLLKICQLHDKTDSAEAITAGLPIANEPFSVDLFNRAAEQAGFIMRQVRKKLLDIPRLACPAILLLRNGQACVLMDINHKTQMASLVIPSVSDDVHDVEFERLDEDYLGVMLLLKQKHQFDERAPSVLDEKGKHWFWSALAVSLPLYKSVLLTSIMINLLAIVSSIFVMNVYDRVVPNNAFETLWVLVIGVMLAFGFDFLVKWLRFYALDKAGKKADIILSSRIMSQVLGLEMTARPSSVGSFARSMQDFESIREFIASSTISSLIDIPCTVIILAVIALFGGWLVMIPIVSMLLMVSYCLILQPFLRKSIEKTTRSSSAKNATLIEGLIGLETIQLYGAESKIQHEWEKHIGFLAKWGAKSKMLSQSTTMVAGFIQQCNTVALIATGVYLISDNTLSMGALIACNMLAGRCMAPISQVVNLLTRFYQSKTALAGLDNIMNLPRRRNPDRQYVNLDNMTGDLELEQVTFAYPDQKLNTLENVTLSIKAGEKIGIIGRIGSGKSTLGKMLLGLYPPSSGLIRLDGLDITLIDPVALRKAVGCVPQDINLFHGTVRDNITLGAGAVDDEVVVKAAKMAGVTDFTNIHPEGLDMPVAERGANLSGGQRQAIAVARAFMHDPSILVLDEPTSSMDHKSEQSIKEQLQEYCQDKTLVLVTHRMSLLDLVDRLIVIDRGKIVADGPKVQVMEALKHGKIVIN